MAGAGTVTARWPGKCDGHGARVSRTWPSNQAAFHDPQERFIWHIQGWLNQFQPTLNYQSCMELNHSSPNDTAILTRTSTPSEGALLDRVSQGMWHEIDNAADVDVIDSP